MIVTKEFVKKLLPVYKTDQHKNDRGKVFVIGGSTGMTGAPTLTANAALRSGCGLVTVGIPASLNNIMEVKLTEAMTYPLKDNNGYFSLDSYEKALEFAKGCNCVAIGMGANKNKGTQKLVSEFLRNYEKNLLIDADGLNVLSGCVYKLENTKADVILTPHIGEFSRLLNISAEEILVSKEKIAMEFAQKYNVVLVLKGKNTLITNGCELFENSTGNEGMATGGSGDVLSGVISALSAQGLSPINSAVAGVYIHGLAGDFAKNKKTVYSMIASDIIENLPDAFKSLMEE